MKKWMIFLALWGIIPAVAAGKGLLVKEQVLEAEYCPVKGEKCSTLGITRILFSDARYTELADSLLKKQLELNSLAAEDLNAWIKATSKIPEPGEEFYPEEYQVSVALLDYSPRYLVLATDYYQYTGGAHGMAVFFFHVYRRDHPQQTLKIADIILPGKQKQLDQLQYRAWLAYLKEQGLSAKRIKEHLRDFEFKATDNWAPTANGLLFLYQPYEIGPYAMGTTELLIPIASLKGIIRPQFLNELKYFNQVIDN